MPIVGLFCAALPALAATGLQLEASLNRQTSQIHVGLLNEGNQTYLATIGTLCGPHGTPGFGFTLQRKGQEDEPLFLTYNKGGEACETPAPWVTVLTKNAQYDFDFLLRELRFKKRSRFSIADLPSNSAYTLIVTYRGAVDSAFVKN